MQLTFPKILFNDSASRFPARAFQTCRDSLQTLQNSSELISFSEGVSAIAGAVCRLGIEGPKLTKAAYGVGFGLIQGLTKLGEV